MKVHLFAVNYLGDIGIENIGVGRLTAFLKEKNIDVKTSYIVNGSKIEKLLEEIDLSCDLYGFSAYPDNVNFIMEVVKEIKKRNSKAIVFLGSKYATSHADLLLEDYDDIDFIMLGDGEFPLLDIVNDLKSGKDIKTICKENKYIKNKENKEDKEVCAIDINLLPWPDRTYLKSKKYIAAYICDCHGCIGKCSFCGQKGNYKKWSGRNARDLMDEIIYVYEETGARIFIFTGGSFEDPGTAGKEKIRELCLLAKEYTVKFSYRCYLRADSFKTEEDRELLKLMSSVGFNAVLIGVESGNEEDLRIYNKRATVEDNHRVLEFMKEANIYASQFGFIMFNPYSNLDKLKQNYEFLVKHKSVFLNKYMSRLFVACDTPIHHTLRDENMLTEDFSWKNQTAYKFIDKEVEKIYNFVEEKFFDTKLFVKERDFYKLVELIYLTENLINLDGIKEEFLESVENIAIIMESYFLHLYKEVDLEMCEKLLPEFLGNMNREYDKCYKLQNKLLKRYLKLLSHR